MRRLLWIGIGLAIAQQFTGVNTIIYYGTSILESTGLGASASIVATVTLGVVSVIGVITGIILLGHFNRRSLLQFGFAAVAISHIVLPLSFRLPESTFRSYLILAAMLVFMIFAVINAVSFLFVRRFMPETRGRTLEELEDDFRAHDAAHFVHEAPAGVHGS
jgi:MFS transporter, SP family, major inositol transporter